MRFPLLLLALLVALAAGPAAATPAEPDPGRPFVVKIHADWCGTCTRLAPTWTRIEQELGGRARVVVLDVTNRERLGRSRELAEELGLGAFFERHRGGTGVIAVLDGATGEPIALHKGETDFAVYERAVEDARRRPGS